MAALLAFCVLAAAFPPVGLAAEGNELAIPAGTDLYDLLKEDTVKNGDTLRCTGTVYASDTPEIDDPWIIDKSITIEGGSLTIGTGGILLGADVTFKNTELLFTKPICNAIVANGYTLTLDGVTASSRGYAFNVFCGTLVPNSTQSFQVPDPGTTNTVIIQGGTNLRSGNMAVVGESNIYAGSLSLGSMSPEVDEAGRPHSFAGSPTIRIEGCADGRTPLGTIYASGAQQRNLFEKDAQKPTLRDTAQYTVSGSVTIEGTNSLPNIDGAGAAAANAVYQGGTYPATKTFTDISSLSVEAGSLALDNASWFRNGGILKVSNGATVDIQNMDSSLSISDFHGGGSLILGQPQVLTITGNVTGETTVGVGKIFNGASDIPTLNHTYIIAQGSSESSFHLAPPNIANPPALIFDGSGNWTATQPTGEISKLVSLRPENIHAESGETEVIIPLNPVCTGLELSLSTLSLAIQVNGAQAAFIENTNPDDSHYEAGGLRLFAGNYDGESLAVYHGDGSYITPILDGTYTIKITVPGEYTVSGNPLTASCTLTVGDSTPVPGEPTVTGISVNSTTHKTEYNTGDSLDVANLTINVAYSDNTAKTVSVTADMVSGFDSRQAAEGQVLTIAYEGRTTTYTVRITAPEEPGNPEYQVILNNLGEGGSGGGSYEAGSIVTIQAGSRNGYIFSAWQHPNTVTLADRNSPETSFVMPSTDVALQAAWEPEGGATPPIPDHIHTWNAAWSSNQTHHWHDCTASGCTVTDNSRKDGYAAHTAGAWVVDRPASSSQDGIRHRSCSICGYVMEQAAIPATGGGSSSGNGPSSEGGSTSGNGPSSEGGAASGSPSSGGSGAAAVKNPDGSTTSTNTNHATGTVTETTSRPDGSKTVVETQKDGTVTTTNTAKDGSTVKVVEHPDGATETTVKQSDGFTASILKDQNGATADVRLPSKEAGEGPAGSVVLPIPALPGENASVTIYTGSDQPVPVEIPVSGNGASTIACLVNSDGSETILKTVLLTEGQITVSVSDGATIHIRDNSKNFLDTGDHWAKDDIDFVAARELFSGETSSAFAPDASMSRAMLMTVLARLDGAEAAGNAAYEQGMAWAVAKGISDGRNPDGQVTREQFLVMLHRYAGSPAATSRELHFRDADEISAYAMDAIRWALENGVINGYEDGSFLPQGKATRAQAAAILSRYVQFLNQQ